MRNRLLRWQTSLLYWLILIWTLLPIWMAFALSIKHPADFFTAKFLPFLQFTPTLDNWRAEWQAFGDPAGMGRSLWNSSLTASLTTLLTLGMGGMAAYALMLWQRTRQAIGWVLALLLLPRMTPPIVMTIPYMLLERALHGSDTLLALVFAHTSLTLPIAVLLLLSAMRELPFELIEAARMDGCSDALIYWRVLLPLLQPALIATAALTFAQSWNEFLFAVTNAEQRMPTAPLAIAALLNKDGIEFEYVGSHLLLVLLPPLLLALLARNFVVRGLSFGLIKERN